MPENKTPSVKKPANIWEKVFAVQQAVGMAKKAGKHEHHKYQYARETDIIDAVKPKLGEQRLVLTMSTCSHCTTEKLHTIGVKFTLTNVDNPEEKIESTVYGTGEDKTGSVVGTPIAYTMALKYFLAKMFVVETGDDAEVSKRGGAKNDTPEAKFAKAKMLISTAKIAKDLVKYKQQVGESIIYDAKQKAELTKLIDERITTIKK